MAKDERMRVARTPSDGELDEVGGSDAVLPEQMFPIMRLARLMPELRLALAVLEDAVTTLRGSYDLETDRGRAAAWQTWEWFQSSDASSPFAFRVICDLLGMDESWLRRGLARWRPLSERMAEPLRGRWVRRRGAARSA